jgi:predicted transcriptional regulator
MKSSTIPAVRVEPELREQLERVLHEGESLSAFVEASVRNAVRVRAEQSAFIARGLASLAAAKRSGRYFEADDVIAELRQRLERARAERKRRVSAGR